MHDRCVTIANDESIRDLISQAQKRLVVVVPGVALSVAKAITERWRALGPGKVQVILDFDPEVIRLGYGEIEAVTVLQAAAAEHQTLLQRHKGIRIGLIIADDTTLIYAPTPKYIEAGPTQPETPNAIVLDAPPPAVAAEVGIGENGVKDQQVGMEPAQRGDIEKLQKDIKENPPQKFDVARTVRVFNAYFEFVDFHLSDVAIGKKSVRLPQEISRLTGDADLDESLRASVQLIKDNPRLSGASLKWFRDRIAEHYLVILPGYGTVILRQLKDEFLVRVDFLRRCVDQFRTRLAEELQAEIDRKREQIVKQILPNVEKHTPEDWRRHIGSKPASDQVRLMLDHVLKGAFGSADDMIRRMRVEVMFKGVTYEMLTDPEFIALTRKKLPGLNQLHNEFDAAKGTASITPQETKR